MPTTAPIPFNKPYLTDSGKEWEYMKMAVANGKLSGNGAFTKACQSFLQERYNFGKCLLTNSCSDALEMAALLLNLQAGDEVIFPDYTFVSTVNTFIMHGATPVFADAQKQMPNIDVHKLDQLITDKTKAIVIVHYAGFACHMSELLELAKNHNLLLIEDAAQAIDAYYLPKNTSINPKPLGSMGHMATFSFHETKNISSGEGGMLVINSNKPELQDRAEIIWEKGTNRTAFKKGEVAKYEWIDTGSSYLPSELTAAFLLAQLENIDAIQQKRHKIWTNYFQELLPLAKRGHFLLPQMPPHTRHNAHLFYLILPSLADRVALINYLKEHQISAVFHYLALHKSPFVKQHYPQQAQRNLPNSIKYTNTLLRLPFYTNMAPQDQERVIATIKQYYS